MVRSIRLQHAEYITTRLLHYSALLKTFSRNGLNDGSIMVERTCSELLNSLFGWELMSTNLFHSNYPAIDLQDIHRRIGVQITSSADPGKVAHTLDQLAKADPKVKLDRLIILFLLPQLPAGSKKPIIKTRKQLDIWSINELLGQMMHGKITVQALADAREALDAEIGLSTLSPAATPELWAQFRVAPSGKVLKAGKCYRMDLWLENVPCTTDRARLKIMDETFEEDEWWIERGKGKKGKRKFLTDDMNSYGDVPIRVQGGLEGPGWRIESTLYQALVRSHGRTKDPHVKEALQVIRDN
jgi:hypothetical protein